MATPPRKAPSGRMLNTIARLEGENAALVEQCEIMARRMKSAITAEDNARRASDAQAATIADLRRQLGDRDRELAVLRSTTSAAPPVQAPRLAPAPSPPPAPNTEPDTGEVSTRWNQLEVD